MFKSNQARFLTIINNVLQFGVPDTSITTQCSESEHAQQVGKRSQGQFDEESFVLLLGKPSTFRNSDVEDNFRQESNFYYLTGCDKANAALTIDLASKQLTLYLPASTANDGVWHGRRVSNEQQKTMYNVNSVQTLDDLKALLVKEFAAKTTFHILEASKAWILELIAEKEKEKGKADATSAASAVPSPSDAPLSVSLDSSILIKCLQASRNVKSALELEAMRRAMNVSCEAHNLLLQTNYVGKYEYQLEADFLHHCWRNGLRFQAYPSIVGAGYNSAVLHYGANKEQVKGGDLILIDAGAEFQNYAADITRTFPANGKFTPDQKLIYQMVLDIQRQLIAAVKPGVDFRKEIGLQCAKLICQAGITLGLFEGNVEEMAEKRVWMAIMPHGLGHLLGQDVHDTTIYPAEVLRPGMVVTVEPGIYFNEDAIELALASEEKKVFLKKDAFAKWAEFGGVRIEDDVLVTQDGHEVLTAAAVKDINEIERLMAKN